MKKNAFDIGGVDREEAQRVWKMLDDMAENDPEGYASFVKEQQRRGRVREKSFVPSAGRVVKTYAMKQGSMMRKTKLFLNLCGHPGVQRPIGANGKELDDDAPGWAAKQIPLLVGQLRETKDSKNATCIVVDVVFSPWIVKRIRDLRDDPRENQFRHQVADLAATWVQDEHGLIVNASTCKYIRSVYKGGHGARGDAPVPFSLNGHAVDEDDEDGKKSGDVKDEDVTDGPSVRKAEAAKKVMKSPQDLLSHMRAQTNEDTIEEVGSNGITAIDTKIKSDKDTSRRRRPFIQEIGPDGDVVAKTSKKKKKVVRPAVKKGFLNRKKHLGLYSTNGSREGDTQAGNPYPWANVVDTRGMSQDTLQKTMKEYGETGTVTECDDRHITKASKSPKVSTSSHRTTTKSSLASMAEDAELTRLMNAVDPEMMNSDRHRTDEKSSSSSFGSKTFMKDLTRMLAGSEDKTLAKLGKESMRALEREQEKTNWRSAADDGNDDNDALTRGMKSMLGTNEIKKPDVSIARPSSDELVVTVDLPMLETIAQHDVDISEASMKLRGRVYRVNVPFPFLIDAERAKAKFSKKRRRLKVRLHRKT